MSEQYPGGYVTKSPVVPDGTTAPGIWNLSQQAYYQAAGTWPGYSVPDAQFNYVTMLLHGDGTNGAAYGGGSSSSSVTPFNVDASTNAFTLTPVNSVQANRLNPYQAGYYSNYFSSSAMLTTASGGAFSFSTGDFCIEAWVNVSSLSSIQTILSTVDSGITGGYSLVVLTSGYLQVDNVPAQTITTSSNALVAQTWNHVAFTKSSGTYRIFVNGALCTTSTNTMGTTLTAASGASIGKSQASGYEFPLTGYLSNVRVVSGSAVYTSAFTPSTTPLTNISGTQLLTCQSYNFLDNSSNYFTLTATNSPAVSAYQPFTLNSSYATYGSGAFPGSSYLSAPSNSAFAFGTGDFTFEAWIYPTTTTDYRTIFSTRGTAANAVYFGLDIGTLKPVLYTNVLIVLSSLSVKLNAWSHVALVRSSGTTTIYVNGVSGGSASDATNYSSTTCAIGFTIADGAYAWVGYLTDTRIVKGTAVYTTTFNPPSSPLTAIANTSLLTCQYNGASNNNGFIDSSPNNFNVIRYASGTQGKIFALGPTSGSFGPYGSNWSNYFDGSSAYLSTPNSTAISLTTGDWTIEGWINPTQVSSYACIYSNGWPIQIYVNSSTIEVFVSADNGGSYIVNGGTGPASSVAVGVWSHFALVKNGNTYTVYVNGVGGTPTTSATAVATSTATSTAIGRFSPSSSYYFSGYISNLRLLKGTAQYTSNFTPPTAPLTAITNTAMLTCQSNRFLDNSINSVVLTANGTPSVQLFNPFGSSTAYSPAVNGASTYFSGGTYITNGTNTWNSLEIANNAALRFGTSTDFTIEMWAYLGSQASTLISDAVVDEGTGNNVGWYVYVDASRYVHFGATGTDFITAPQIPAFNSWFHFALVRSGSTTTMYINGVSSGSTSSSINMNAATDVRPDTPWMIGCIEHYYWSGCLGYISDVRVANKALYTGAFTPNTTPLTSVGGTQLLLNMNAEAVYDNSKINNLVTAGDVRISTAVKKYGTGSLYFDGTSDGLYGNVSNPNINFGTGDFTIEMWVYTSNLAAYQCLVDTRASDTSSAYGAFINDSGYPYWYDASSSQTSTIAVASNTWTHIAFVRGSGTLRIFVNGVQGYSGSNTNSQNSTNKLVLGMNISQSAPYSGYMDDFRITKGYARYSSTFTPPTKAFPSYGPN